MTADSCKSASIRLAVTFVVAEIPCHWIAAQSLQKQGLLLICGQMATGKEFGQLPQDPRQNKRYRLVLMSLRWGGLVAAFVADAFFAKDYSVLEYSRYLRIQLRTASGFEQPSEHQE